MRLRLYILIAAIVLIFLGIPLQAQVLQPECPVFVKDLVNPGATVNLCNLSKQVGMFSVLQAGWGWERASDVRKWYVDAYKFATGEIADMATPIIRNGQARARNQDFDEKVASLKGRKADEYEVVKIPNGRALYEQMWNYGSGCGDPTPPKLVGYECTYVYIADPIYVSYETNAPTKGECDSDFAKAGTKAGSIPIEQIK